MVGNRRDMTKCQKFLHDNDDDTADTKAIAIPWVFSENSRAKNGERKECAIMLPTFLQKDFHLFQITGRS